MFICFHWRLTLTIYFSVGLIKNKYQSVAVEVDEVNCFLSQLVDLTFLFLQSE